MSGDQIDRINSKLTELKNQRQFLCKTIEYLQDARAKSGAEFTPAQNRQLEETQTQLGEVDEQIERWEDRRDRLLADLDKYKYDRAEVLEILRVLVGLQPPGEKYEHLRIERPEGLQVLRTDWLEGLVEDIRDRLLLDFDLRRKEEGENEEEIIEWKSQPARGEWMERRRDHDLRIRTMVDDLFERNLPLSEVTTSIRAWKVQVADVFSEQILDMFHLRPSAVRTWASYRLQIHDVGRALEQALDYKDQLLRSEKLLDARLLQDTIRSAYEAARDLTSDIRERDFARQSE